MTAPAIYYATPGGILTPRARAASLLATMERMRVSLPPALPTVRGR